MGNYNRSNCPNPDSQNSLLLSGLLEWCARATDSLASKIIDPDQPFHCHQAEWGKRFKLRNALLPWVLENTTLTTFYPDELQTNSTPRSVARHLADRLASGHERPVRPPILPRKTGKIEDPTVFVLGCPRSGTTIFRCMLMGHSQIYAGPELHMMQFESLRQRERALLDAGNFWMVMGFAQTIQDLTGWSEREAFHYMSTLTKRDLPIEDVYRILHGYSRKPILVDKSPSNTLSIQDFHRIIDSHSRKPIAIDNSRTPMPDFSTLERIESRFSEPRYIYITRHPCAVIESMVRLEAPPFDKLTDTSAAEKVWLDSNTMARTFLERIPRVRWHQLSYEDLMQSTEKTLGGVTNFLGVAYESSMAKPYKDDRQFHGVGCVNLPKRPGVEPELAEKWKEIHLERPLLPETVSLATSLGYDCSRQPAGSIQI